jgi:hypothetical protein
MKASEASTDMDGKVLMSYVDKFYLSLEAKFTHRVHRSVKIDGKIDRQK